MAEREKAKKRPKSHPSELKGKRRELNGYISIFGMKRVVFELESLERKHLVLFGLANSLGIKRFPHLSVSSAYSQKVYSVSCIKPIIVSRI